MTCAPVIRLHLAHVKKRKRFGTTDCQFRNSSLAVHMWSSACGRAECSRPRLAMLCADVRFSPSMLVSKLSSPSSGYCQNQSTATRWNAVAVAVSFAVNVCRVGGPTAGPGRAHVGRLPFSPLLLSVRRAPHLSLALLVPMGDVNRGG